uniref:Helicase ATP-binding domain-containing protein n=1 Tax=Strongyloides stercoralis TaxID=6248 RepID=A0A0K0EBJ5_STRER
MAEVKPEGEVKFTSTPVSTAHPRAHSIEDDLAIKLYESKKDTFKLEYEFELDIFQKKAIVCISEDHSCFVAAHTSAGKTVVAENAIAQALSQNDRAIYTSPIKALSNQKFRDFKKKFDDVGLMTGDYQINEDGRVLIMTTEILRSMLYENSSRIYNLGVVVFDEVHYINNDERGHVWEEVLILLPPSVTIVMLSATVPNCMEFADWVGRVKDRNIIVIQTLFRPVPLEHYVYCGFYSNKKGWIEKVYDGKRLIKQKSYETIIKSMEESVINYKKYYQERNKKRSKELISHENKSKSSKKKNNRAKEVYSYYNDERNNIAYIINDKCEGAISVKKEKMLNKICNQRASFESSTDNCSQKSIPESLLKKGNKKGNKNENKKSKKKLKEKNDKKSKVNAKEKANMECNSTINDKNLENKQKEGSQNINKVGYDRVNGTLTPINDAAELFSALKVEGYECSKKDYKKNETKIDDPLPMICLKSEVVNDENELSIECDVKDTTTPEPIIENHNMEKIEKISIKNELDDLLINNKVGNDVIKNSNTINKFCGEISKNSIKNFEDSSSPPSTKPNTSSKNKKKKEKDLQTLTSLSQVEKNTSTPKKKKNRNKNSNPTIESNEKSPKDFQISILSPSTKANDSNSKKNKKKGINEKANSKQTKDNHEITTKNFKISNFPQQPKANDNNGKKKKGKKETTHDGKKSPEDLLKKVETSNLNFQESIKQKEDKLFNNKEGSDKKMIKSNKRPLTYMQKKRNTIASYDKLIKRLERENMIPMVIFVFSRNTCDEYLQSFNNIDLTNELEKLHIEKFFHKCLKELGKEDRTIPQVMMVKEAAIRGFGVHHSGILPLLKEIIEMLFSKGRIKVLFATETFAMGVNMPTKTVVFDSLDKHDGKSKRALTCTEYIQMAGRAGRRGLDTVGNVIIMPNGRELCDFHTMRKSKFRITYRMMLSLIRSGEEISIEKMLSQSFAEKLSIRHEEEKEAEIESLKNVLDKTEKVSCISCGIIDGKSTNESIMEEFYNASLDFLEVREKIFSRIKSLIDDNIIGVGKYIIFNYSKLGFSNSLGCITSINNSYKRPIISVATLVPKYKKNDYVNIIKMNKNSQNNDGGFEKYLLLLKGLLNPYPEFVTPHDDVNNSEVLVICDIPVDEIVGIVKGGESNLKFWQEVQEYYLTGSRSKNHEHSPSRAIPTLYFAEKDIHNSTNLMEKLLIPGCNLNSKHKDISEEYTKYSIYRETLTELFKSINRCNNYTNHYENYIDIKRQSSRIETLEKKQMEGLILKQDYEAKLKVLKDYNYVTENELITLKGHVGCYLHYFELMISELIMNNAISKLSDGGITALFSIFALEGRKNYAPAKDIPKDAKRAPKEELDEIEKIFLKYSEELRRVHEKHQAVFYDEIETISYSGMEVAYLWTEGVPLTEILMLTTIPEGNMVRMFQRTLELFKDVSKAAEYIQDRVLASRIEELTIKIKRGIMFQRSLYTHE